MAVFTTFSESALSRYLVMYGIGELVHCEAITGGIENSNYFVTLADGDQTFEFVLTITEDLSFEDAPFFNALFNQLVKKGLPVPNPERTLDGMSSTIFCGKPTWLFPRLPGTHPDQVSIEQCRTIGETLALIHASAASTPYDRANPYDLAWVESTLEEVGQLLAPEDKKTLGSITRQYSSFVLGSDLPAGIIHGDLFRDNALFEGETLTGVIDFYHACRDFYAQDIAIAANDWCTNPDGTTSPERLDALLAGYNKVRELSPEEKQALPMLRKFGAMRFVLTRLISGENGAYMKDPAEFMRILRALDH